MSGFSPRWKNKKIAKFNKFANNIKLKQLFYENKFKLLKRNADRYEIEVSHKGAWLLCNNGCLKWSILICSFKISTC